MPVSAALLFLLRTALAEVDPVPRLAAGGGPAQGADPQPGRAFRRFLQAARAGAEVRHLRPFRLLDKKFSRPAALQPKRNLRYGCESRH